MGQHQPIASSAVSAFLPSEPPDLVWLRGRLRGFPWSASWRRVINYTPSAISARDATGPGAMRIDRWLFRVRKSAVREKPANSTLSRAQSGIRLAARHVRRP